MENPNEEELTGVKKLTPKEEAWHNEQERKSKDLVRVYNPTNKDFRVNWDGNIFVIPAKSEKTLIYYVATKYVRDMKDQLINEQNEKELARLLAERVSKGQLELTPYERQTLIDKMPHTDNEKLVGEIYSTLWLGIEEEFGLDGVVEMEEERLATIPVEEKVLANMQRRYVPKVQSEADSEALQKPDVPSNHKKIAEEVSI